MNTLETLIKRAKLFFFVSLACILQKELQRYHNSSKYLMDLLWDDLNYVPEIGVMKT